MKVLRSRFQEHFSSRYLFLKYFDSGDRLRINILDEIAIIISIHTFDNSLAMTFDRMTFGILTNISLTNMYSDNL